MPMKNPPHPGLSVRHDCLEPLGLTVTEAARRLGVSRKQLSELVNGRSGISPEMAIRLNNLARLLKATNRLAEAEPLMRRALLIDENSFLLVCYQAT